MESVILLHWVEALKKKWQHFRFGTKAQLAFLEDFYTLVNDGIPANKAIDMMADATSGMSHAVSLSISQKISQGQPLAEGMREWFGINIVEIIRVGEQGGALVATLRSAINTLGRSTGAMGAFVGAISYPLMVIVMACGVILYLDSSVLGQFRAIKPVEQWPAAGKSLVAAAELIRYWWWIFLFGGIGLVMGVFRIMRDYVGDLRSTLDQLPLFKLYKQFVAARFMETLGLLVSNGVVFRSALKVMQYRGSPYLVSHLVVMEHLLSTGKGNIADILETGLIDEKDILRLRIMAEVKGFEHGLIRMGVRGAENSAKSLKTMSKILGGLLMVVGAWLIITIVKGIYLTGMAMGQA